MDTVSKCSEQIRVMLKPSRGVSEKKKKELRQKEEEERGRAQPGRAAMTGRRAGPTGQTDRAARRPGPRRGNLSDMPAYIELSNRDFSCLIRLTSEYLGKSRRGVSCDAGNPD